MHYCTMFRAELVALYHCCALLLTIRFKGVAALLSSTVLEAAP